MTNVVLQSLLYYGYAYDRESGVNRSVGHCVARIWWPNAEVYQAWASTSMGI